VRRILEFASNWNCNKKHFVSLFKKKFVCSSDNKLYLGSGVEIHTQVGEAFHVEERSRNGSWISGWGLKESRAFVQAKLEAVIHPSLGKFELENPIISQGELYIYPRITISPGEVILPWDTQIKPK
jgi:hypothetical protein